MKDRAFRDKELFGKVALCILTAALALYIYMDRKNDVIELRLMIPTLAKEVKLLQEENVRLGYELDQFESPIHLMELARKPEMGHLRYPFNDEMIFLPE